MKLAFAFLLLATPAIAEPWVVPDGHGGWKDNPSCSSAACRSTGIPDTPKTNKKTDSHIPSTLAHQAWTGGCGWLVNTTQLITHTAAGNTDAEAARQCKARVAKLQKAGHPVPVYSHNWSVFGGLEVIGYK